jgi:NAD(P)-dependent dehydrogenase (short-subunit alcohol dehydrogenase family)
MKTVLITGCSSGYGRSTALRFVEGGWNVIATMRSPERQAVPLAESDRLRVLRLDVTEPASIAGAIAEGMRAFGGLDVLVNNAGIGLFSAFEVTPDATIRELFETNVFGVMAVSRAVIPHFRERRAGTLVNVTSSVGIVPMPLVSPYAASKLAIEGFTEALAYELSYFGVRARIVQPGYAPTTSFTVNSAERMQGLVPNEYAPYAAQLMGAFANGKHTSADDVAEAVWRAATDDGTRLRYPAGPDAEELAALRVAMPGEAYLERMRAMVGPNVAVNA